jgi:hypothetical protein
MFKFLFGVAFGAAGYWAWQSFGRDLLGMGDQGETTYGGFSSPSTSTTSFNSPSTTPSSSTSTADSSSAAAGSTTSSGSPTSGT